MIKSIVFGKWNGSSDWYVSSRWQLFYRVKSVACSLLNLEPSRDTDVYNHVHVTYTDGGTYGSDLGTVHWYEAIVVGYGVFKNWWVTYYQDSD